MKRPRFVDATALQGIRLDPAEPAHGEVLLYDGDGKKWTSGTPASSSPYVAPPTTGWAWVNQGSATVDETATDIYLAGDGVGGDNFRHRVRSMAAGKTVVAAYRWLASSSGGYPTAGLVFRESSSGKFVTVATFAHPTFGGQMAIHRFNSPTSWAGSYVTLLPTRDLMWMKLVDDGTNRVVSLSVDGARWHQVHSVGRTDFMTADQYGITVNAHGSPVGLQLLHWVES